MRSRSSTSDAAPTRSTSPHARRRSLLGSLALGGIVALAVAAPPRRATADEAEGRELGGQAITAFRAGHLREACALYERAYQADPQRNYAYNAARLRDKLGEWTPASQHYERWLESKPPEDDRRGLRDKLSTDATDAQRDEDPELAIHRLRLARSLGLPPDPEITRRLAVLLESMDRLGEALSHYRLALNEGHIKRTTLESAIERLQERVSVAHLTVPQVKAGDVLEVDGKEVEMSPGESVELSPGNHRVVLRRPGFEPALAQVALQPGGRVQVELELMPAGAHEPPPPAPEPAPATPSSGPTWPRWTALSAGAVGLLAGGALLLAGQSSYADKNDCIKQASCIDSGEAQDLADEADQRFTLGAVGLGVGAAAVAAGVVLWMLEDEPSEAAAGDASASAAGALRVLPLAAADGVGVGVVGRF